MASSFLLAQLAVFVLEMLEVAALIPSQGEHRPSVPPTGLQPCLLHVSIHPLLIRGPRVSCRYLSVLSVPIFLFLSLLFTVCVFLSLLLTAGPSAGLSQS